MTIKQRTLANGQIEYYNEPDFASPMGTGGDIFGDAASPDILEFVTSPEGAQLMELIEMLTGAGGPQQTPIGGQGFVGGGPIAAPGQAPLEEGISNAVGSRFLGPEGAMEMEKNALFNRYVASGVPEQMAVILAENQVAQKQEMAVGETLRRDELASAEKQQATATLGSYLTAKEGKETQKVIAEENRRQDLITGWNTVVKDPGLAARFADDIIRTGRLSAENDKLLKKAQLRSFIQAKQYRKGIGNITVPTPTEELIMLAKREGHSVEDINEVLGIGKEDPTATPEEKKLLLPSSRKTALELAAFEEASKEKNATRKAAADVIGEINMTLKQAQLKSYPEYLATFDSIMAEIDTVDPVTGQPAILDPLVREQVKGYLRTQQALAVAREMSGAYGGSGRF